MITKQIANTLRIGGFDISFYPPTYKEIVEPMSDEILEMKGALREELTNDLSTNFRNIK